MIFIYGLRLVSDLALYFFFANCIVKSWVLASIPAACYAIYLIATKKLDTTWDRQSDLFSLSWKLFIGFGVFVCLTGKSDVFLQRGIPMAVLSMASSILLLRMLRHGPDIYLNKQYQLKNFLLFSGVFGITWVLSSKFMLQLTLNSIRFMYNGFVLPILNLIITCVTAIIGLFLRLLSWLHLTKIDFGESKLPSSETVNPFKDAVEGAMTQSQSAEMVLTILGALVLLIGAFFLFRRLASKDDIDSRLSHGRILSKTEVVESASERSTSTSSQVRRQYRKYLKLCKAYGAHFSKSDTSAHVAAESEKLFSDFSDTEELRDIYIRARYNNQATKSDLRKIKQFYQTLKQKL